MNTMYEAAGRTAYPGRGIVIGQSADGAHAVLSYFIMGRSENSRNRVFVKDGDGLRTKAHDPSKLADPSLIIYHPVRVLGDLTIVTNGDQTDTVYEHLSGGGDFYSALRTREFEPDAPNYTPRISALVTRRAGGFSYMMNILKSAGGDPASCHRFFYEYETPLPGQAHFLHTYMGDGNPLPSFMGEPEAVTIAGDIDAYTNALWGALDHENKVSLFVRFIRLEDGKIDDRIINKLA